ncbi:hypothetical protein KCU_02774 [Pasteurella multocida subsp. multocida str. P52VAC]|nr:hypothetical protein PMCN03_0529 [Pasteurella multocida subsp. multocida str. HB03]APW55131.1 hypothetical protein PMCN07_0546 [Pasteurella multocida subsp. multocida str. HN07]EJS85149.1 hypothetical protein KCU_02774 [Pasteurella multocida subsp. multocida str. P52VAC]EJZ80621.1 hypothetical protein P1059_00573 [Pasteurella multocida subsp. gallicida P1059]
MLIIPPELKSKINKEPYSIIFLRKMGIFIIFSLKKDKLIR